MNLKVVALVTIAGLTALFIVQNVAGVEVQFLFWSLQMPRSLLMFLLLAAGVCLGWFLRSYVTYRGDSRADGPPDRAP